MANTGQARGAAVRSAVVNGSTVVADNAVAGAILAKDGVVYAATGIFGFIKGVAIGAEAKPAEKDVVFTATQLRQIKAGKRDSK